MYWKELTDDMVSMGIGSLGIMAVVSVSFGAVMAVQTAYQITSDLIPKRLVATITRDSSILKLSPTIGCLILTGRIGSRIASQIGTMRVTEQIDALEIMGINSPGYLITPKLLSGITMIPLLVIISMFRSEEHTSELQSLMRISYAVSCLQPKRQAHLDRSTRDVAQTAAPNDHHTHPRHHRRDH